MANYVRVDVVCPCGKLLESRNSNADSNSVTRGTKRCPSCKKNIRFEVVGGRAYTSEQK